MRSVVRAPADPPAGAEPLPGQRGGGVVHAPLDVRADVLRASAISNDLAVRLPQLLVDADRVPVGAMSVGAHSPTIGRGYPRGNQHWSRYCASVVKLRYSADVHMATHT